MDYRSSPILSGAVMGAALGQVDSEIHTYEKVATAVLQSFALEKRAAARHAFEELTEEPVDLLGEIYQAKLASVADEHLLDIAKDLPGDTLETYEALGGEYKVAFGQPMFSAPSPTPGTGPTGAPKMPSLSAGPQRPSIGQGPTGGGGLVSGSTGTPGAGGMGAGGMGAGADGGGMKLGSAKHAYMVVTSIPSRAGMAQEIDAIAGEKGLSDEDAYKEYRKAQGRVGAVFGAGSGAVLGGMAGFSGAEMLQAGTKTQKGLAGAGALLGGLALGAGLRAVSRQAADRTIGYHKRTRA